MERDFNLEAHSHLTLFGLWVWLCENAEALEADRNFKPHDLPVFGGAVPLDTEGIWSWDENMLLVSGEPGGDPYVLEGR